MRRLVLACAMSGLVCGVWSSDVAASSLTTTITGATDYLFDGISQNQGIGDERINPVLQLSVDWSHDSGFFLGTWASNVDFGDDPTEAEVDYYGGYNASYESGWGWTAGVFHYSYIQGPSSFDYTEGSVGVTFPGGTKLQYWGTDDEALGGSAGRLKAKHSFALPDDYSLDLEATRTEYSDSGFKDYTHAQVGVSKAFESFTAYLGYVTTDRDVGPNDEGRFLFSISTTLTWFE